MIKKGIVENLKGIIGETGQGVVKKTADISEITRLRGLISDNQDEIRRYYASIGERYYKMYSDSPVDEVRELVESIKRMEQRIENYQAQINKIKGIVPCPYCGKDTSINVQFCGNCGRKMPQKVKNLCSCGATITEGAKYCMKCGTPVGVKKVRSPVQSAQRQCPKCGLFATEDMMFCANCGFNFNSFVSETIKVTVDEEKQICPKCGNKLENGETFCSECGTAVNKDTNNADFLSFDEGSNLAVQMVDESAVAPPEKNVCPRCGSEIANDDAFCAECGYRL